MKSCAFAAPTPHTRNTYFWCDADWAVLWPYYCSPFPWHMDKSKALLTQAGRDPRHRPCVGSIAHSIGRYQDYEGNQFPGLAVDWGVPPGQIGNADITSSKGPNDFRLWHYQRWVRDAGFRGLYVDENYLGLEDNFLTGNAYWRNDGLLQRGYNHVGLRDYFKRLKVMFHQNNVPSPNLWQHITSSAHLADGRALLWIVNKSRKDVEVKVAVDWKMTGLDLKQVTASNAETGEAVGFTAHGFTVPVLQRDFVPVLIAPR